MSRPIPQPPASALLRFAKWLALAIACAAPSAILTFPKVDAATRAAEAAGIVAAAIVLASCERRLGIGRPESWRRSLPLGFLAWAAVQGGVAWVAAGDHAVVRVVALSLYSLALIPYVVVAFLVYVAILVAAACTTSWPAIPFEVFEFVAVFVLALFCVLPNLMAGIYATNLIELLCRPVVTLRPRPVGSIKSGRAS